MFGGSQLIEPVYMVVLTGGPCSGKSSSLAYLTEKLTDSGFMVFVIPETATLITGNGIDRRKMDRPRQVLVYEEAILDMQLSFEETYREAVTRIFPEKKKVLLLDRGVMDIKAFMPHEEFYAILKRKGLREAQLRDRYHAVVHLVTAADGARKHYTGENNQARIETPEEAIVIDHRIRESWLGHPRFRLIDNRTDFEGKMHRTFSAISQLLGIPAVRDERERYVIKSIKWEELPTHRTIEIEQVCLKSKSRDEEIWIKRRGQDDSYLYFLTRTRTGGGRVEEEELITEQQYSNLKRLKEPGTEALVKDRTSFFWNGRHFDIDRYRDRHEGLSMVEVEAGASPGQDVPKVDANADANLPPFISVQKAVTNNLRYDERRMAARKSKKK